MGGYVFGVVARRLTSEQHAALFRYAFISLQPFSRHGIVSPRTASDKITHGDLDILIGNWAEGEGFKYNFAVDAEEANSSKQKAVDASYWRVIGDSQGHQWSAEEVTEWARSVATVLGAKSWQNHQHGVSLAIPCDVLGELVPDIKPEEFFQIDIRMIRPDRFDFAVFIMSYGTTALLLAQAVRCLSPALVIHHEHLVCRHAPFPGQPPIEIEITASPVELLGWLELDRVPWISGFETQLEFWKWIAGIVEDNGKVDNIDNGRSLIQTAWKMFADTDGDLPKVRIRHQHPRFEEVEMFREWLRTTNTYRPDEPVSRSTGVAVLPKTAGGLTRPLADLVYRITTTTLISVDRQFGRATTMSENTAVVRVDSGESNSSTRKSDAPTLDPTQPIPLDDFARGTLERFGKAAAYEAALGGAVAMAEEAYRKRERRRRNREFATQREDPAARQQIAQQRAKEGDQHA